MILRTALFVTILSVSAVSAIFKDGNHYAYTYNGEVKIGTNKPAEFYTYSRVKANVHVKPVKGDLHIYLKNVNYVSYSGKATNDVEGATKEVQLPQDAEILTKPFIYHRYNNETENGITTSQDDEAWSVKMKQAIASLFYITQEGLNKDKPSSCYSKDFMMCSVKRNEDNLQMLVSNKLANHPHIFENDHVDKDLIIRRTYDLKVDEDGFTLNKVASTSSYDNHQNVDLFYINVKQNLEMIEDNTSDVNEINTEGMTYRDVDRDVLDRNERRSNNLSSGKKTDAELKTALENVYNNLNELKLTTKRLYDESDDVEDFLYALKDLNEEQLTNLYTSVHDDTKLNHLTDFLLKLITLTNNPKPLCFITTMIETGKLNDKQSMNLLGKMAAEPIALTECLEKGLLKLSNDEEIKKRVRNQAVLTLSSMIRVSPDNDDKYEDIVRGFIKNFKNCKLDSDKAVYLYALFNVNNLVAKLELIDIARATDEEYKDLSGHIRAIAANSIRYDHYRDFIFQDLIDNTKQDFEVRASALNALLDSVGKKNSVEIIRNLLLKTDDEDLYQLLYARLRSTSKVTSRDKSKALKAKKLLHQLYKPGKIPETATSQFIDSTDELTGIGMNLEINTYGNMNLHEFITAHVKLTMRDLYWKDIDYELYVHATNGHRSSSSFLDILSTLNDMSMNREVVLKKNGFVVSVEPFDIKRMMAEVFQNKLKSSDVSAYQIKHMEEVVHTEMGIPVVFTDRMYCLTKIDTEFFIHVNEEEGRLSFDGKRKCVNNYEISAYNPLVNMWNGAQSYIDAESYLPIDISLKTTTDSPALKGTFTFKRNPNPMGVQMLLRNYVYMEGEDDEKVGQVSCPKCDIENVVTKGEAYRENRVLAEGYVEDVGLEYKLSTFDCENHYTLADLLKKKRPVVPYAMCGINLLVGNKDGRPVTETQLTYNVDLDRDSLSDELTILKTENIQLNYTLKNEDNVLKTWDMAYDCTTYVTNRSECDMTAVSKKDGVVDRTVKIDVSKTYHNEDVHVTYKIESTDAKKPEEPSKLVIEHTATSNNEINAKMDKEQYLEDCEKDTGKNFQECLQGVSAFRLNTFNVSYTNLRPECEALWTKITDVFRFKYGDKFKRLDKQNIEDNRMEVKVTHPIRRDGIDVTVMTPHESYQYNDLTFNTLINFLFVTPYNNLNYDNELTNGYCETGLDYVTEHYHSDGKDFKYGDDWVKMAANCDEESEKCVWIVKVKKVDNNLAVRFQVANDEIEVEYKDDFVVKLNDKLLEVGPNQLTRVSPVLDVMTLTQDGATKRVILHVVPKVINIEVMKDRVRMSLPYYNVGQCRN